METVPTQQSLAELVEEHRWPTVADVVEPIIAGLRRLNDLDGVADAIATHLGTGHVDPLSIHTARRFVALVDDIARQVRAVGTSIGSNAHGADVGLLLDHTVRAITNDRAVAVELHYLRRPD